MIKYPRRLIEVDLPIKRISAHSRREKSIRHGHISTLHIWWARRPLAACRAVLCAILWPDPVDVTPEDVDRARRDGKALEVNVCPPGFRDRARKEMLSWTSFERQKLLSEESRKRFNVARKEAAVFDDPMELRGALLDFIADFANWENSTVAEYLATARALTEAAHEGLGGHKGTRPLVIDPFAGGGSIPLEAMRVGADAFGSDYNPVAVLLNKIILEYTPKFGQRLADEVRKSGEWIKHEAREELAPLYPETSDGAMPIAYIWARTVLSEAPGSGALAVEIPLIRSLWLAKKASGKSALRWLRDREGRVKTEKVTVHVADGTSRTVLRPFLEVFQPKRDLDVGPGTSAGGAATCPVTGYTMAVERVRHQLESRKGGARDSRLVSVVEVHPNTTGRFYRVPTPGEETALKRAEDWLADYEQRKSGSDPSVPNGSINHLRGFFNIVLYGMKEWGDVFNARQLAVLLTLGRLVRKVGEQAVDQDISGALEACLAVVLGRMADGNSSLTRWQTAGEKISNTFGRQALPMVWDYAEANPFCDATRSLDSMFEWIVEVIEHETSKFSQGHAERASATRHPLPDDSADAVVTDPPYYAAVPYADLSDFFYSWLAPALKSKLPELFSEPLTPKVDECVQLSHRAAMYRNKDKMWFETMMAQACSEARRFTRPEGAGLFVFASKETDAWEAMLAALIEAGWIVTASWPVDTEMSSRLRAQGSATLASSVHIVCRPRDSSDGSVREKDVGDWRDVLGELPRRIHEWMPRMADEGVVGADAIFACLGPALEIFSRHSRVEKASGEVVTLKEYLEYVWAAVAKEALSMLFRDADTAGFEPDARLTAMWLWTLKDSAEESVEGEEDDDAGATNGKKGKSNGFMLEFDAARKIAQGLGASLEAMPSLVEVKGATARLLPVAERTAALFGKDEMQAPTSTRKKKDHQLRLALFDELSDESQAEAVWREKTTAKLGDSTLDRVHQSMILFATGRGEGMKRFLVEDDVGRDPRFWRLAQALSALYPPASDEKRWVDGVLARKKGLGL